MSDKPSPFEDVRRGLGLLFRAARTTVERLPKTDLEEAVVTSAREVGRALENVGMVLEREVFGKKNDPRARVSVDDATTKHPPATNEDAPTQSEVEGPKGD